MNPALLQATIILALVGLCIFLYRRYRKRYLFWWAVAWSLYLLRLAAIITFVGTHHQSWLFAHQVLTGWTALALLWSAIVFSRDPPLKPVYLILVLVPLAWSLLAVQTLGSSRLFYVAAVPAVVFLSAATLWTSRVFLRFRRQTGSRAAMLLGGAFLLWGLHHLDYPLLRARGAWNPWGYYLDILFALAVGFGMVLLVLEDTDRGLGALAALSGDLQRTDGGPDVLGGLLARPLGLAGVRGSVMYLRESGRYVRGAGVASSWAGREPSAEARPAIRSAVEGGKPVSVSGWREGVSAEGVFAFAAVLPVFRRREVTGAMIIVGDARDPFTALDQSFLLALGQQVGAALENADLYRNLRGRSEDLERLSVRMIHQHEEERRRISLELHDETAQVFSAVKLQLGMLKEKLPAAHTARLERIIALVDAGMSSIRSVTEALRPSLLDDLGLIPALRALVTDFGARSGLSTRFTAPDALPGLEKDAELALFRAVQEGLANVARHAKAKSVEVTLRDEGDRVLLELVDDGHGPVNLDQAGNGAGHMGLAGMRERFTSLGGRVELEAGSEGGARLMIVLPREAPSS